MGLKTNAKLMHGHQSRDAEEIREAKHRVQLKKSVFSTKKQFRQIFNDFMAPRMTDEKPTEKNKMLRRLASSPRLSTLSNAQVKPFAPGINSRDNTAIKPAGLAGNTTTNQSTSYLESANKNNTSLANLESISVSQLQNSILIDEKDSRTIFNSHGLSLDNNGQSRTVHQRSNSLTKIGKVKP